MADELFDEIIKYLQNPSDDGLPLEKVKEDPLGCRHRKADLDDVAKKVTCRECGKELDPFWYLSLLAQEWRIRVWQDERVLEAHEALKQAELNRKGRGWIYERPKKGSGVEAWDTFVKWLGHEPFAIYYRGDWTATDGKGSGFSLSYALMMIRAQDNQNLPATPEVSG